jgi:hypothetical protein
MGFGGYAQNGGFDEGTKRRGELARKYPNKPKRTVFSSSMVVHVWAQQSQTYGTNAKASLFFDGATLYSYGRHYVLARFATSDVVLINDETSSYTTSEHKYAARRAVDGKRIFSVKYPEAADAEAHQKNLDWFADTAADSVSIAENPRYAGQNRTAAARRARHILSEALAYQKAFFPRRRKAPFVIPDLTPYIDAAAKADAAREFRRASRAFESADHIREKRYAAKTLLVAAYEARKIGAVIDFPNPLSVLKTFLYARRAENQLESLIGDSRPYGGIHCFADHAQVTAVGNAYGGDFRRTRRYTTGEYRPRSYSALDSFISELRTEADLLAQEARIAESRREYEARRDEQRRLAALSDAEKIEAWRRGADVRISGHAYPCMLRIDGANVETSWGAEFPAEHARKAWPLIRAVYTSGKAWWTNGHKIPLGHFQVDSIDADGTLRAGCHTLSKSEVEHCAALLGLMESV